MSHAMQMLLADDEKEEHGASCYRISLENFIVPLAIGAYDHERGRLQRVQIDLELTIDQDISTIGDRLSAVISYDDLLGRIERMACGRHINLLETLVAEIAGLCFADVRVRCVSISARKLDIFGGRAVPGVHCEMTRPGRCDAKGRRLGKVRYSVAKTTANRS